MTWNGSRLLVPFATLFLCTAAPLAAQDPAHAEQLARQAEDALNHQDTKTAAALAEQAIKEDPRCGRAYGVRGATHQNYAEFTPALLDLNTAVELLPNEPTWHWVRASSYLLLDMYREALDDAEAGLRDTHDPRFIQVRGWARMYLGQVDEGMADLDECMRIMPDPTQNYHFAGFLAKADWKAMLEEGRAMEKMRPHWTSGHLYQVIGAMHLGDYEEARKATERCEAARPGANGDAKMCRAFLHCCPAAKDLYDFDKALATIRSLNPPETNAFLINVAAHVFYDSGRYYGAIQEISAHSKLNNFESLFLLAASHFRLGNLPEAKKYLADARRLNPYISRHTDTVPGMTAFLKHIDDEVAKEQSSGDRASLEKEHDTHLLSVSELETLVRRFQFEKALAGYQKYAASLQSPVRKKEAEERIAQVQGVVGPFQRFREALNGGKVKDLTMKVAGVDVTLAKAVDDQQFEYTMKQGGGKGVWASLGPEGILKLLDRVSPTAEERLGMGVLAWDLGLATRAMDDLQRAVKEDAKLKDRLDAFVASRRGIEVPSGGFVVYKGAYVTPEEKTNLEKGLVLFQGQWVTTADRGHLAKGEIFVGGKWVPGDEKQLLAMGYRKYKDKWHTREEYVQIRSKWEDAYTVSTVHYDIRTNYGDEFAEELGKLCEVAYEEYKKFYGGKEPKLGPKERMTLYAFLSYEDYRRYCVEHHAEAELQAAGFAVSNSNVVVGWNKAGEMNELLATMVHEAGHLYYFRIASGAGIPSWYAEGMATQFEGFHWTGAAYAYDRLSRDRLPFVKQAMQQGRHIPLEQLMSGDALTLINSDTDKALLFYAECWALVYFFTQTNQPEYRDAFQKYRDAADSGKGGALKDFFPDLAAVEADFVKFIKRL